jgi:hypothetical protein
LDLRKLSEYSSYSVSRIRRWLTDSVCPLPHYIIGGKILVKVDDFDNWITNFKRGIETKKDVDAIINSVFKDLAQGR